MKTLICAARVKSIDKFRRGRSLFNATIKASALETPKTAVPGTMNWCCLTPSNNTLVLSGCGVDSMPDIDCLADVSSDH